jgi:hypothetical protein
MRVFAHYNTSGNVRALITVDAPEGTNLMLTPPPGHLVAEVDAPTVKPSALDVEALRKLAKGLHITDQLPRARPRKP